MPPRRNLRRRAENVPPTEKSRETKRIAAQKQPVVVPKATSAPKAKARSAPRNSSKIEEERPATRRSTRIQQLKDSLRPPVSEELPNVKPKKKPGVNQRQSTQATLKARKTSKRPGEKVSVAIPAPTRALRNRSHTQPVSSWLENVDPTVGEPSQVSDPADSLEIAVPEDSFENMPENSSSVSGAPLLISESGVTQKTIKPRISLKTFRKLLKARNALPNKSSKDDRTEQFLSAFRTSRDQALPLFDGTDELWTLISRLDACRNNANENSRSRRKVEQLVESITDELHKWRTMLDLATITEAEFKGDLLNCQQGFSNEAVLQRTILPEILNRHQLQKMFIFSFEGQWESRGKSALPSINPDDKGITGPKPDLAIFFNIEALESDSAPIPDDIETALRPEGNEPLCFPFLFIEVKKQDDALTPALEKNMHTANQALFNIFRWMQKAGRLDSFFQDVRTFSISFNAHKMIARVHRAELTTGDLPLNYAYDDLITIAPYTKRQACKLIRSILLEYGAQKLHETLENTFQKVSTMFKNRAYPVDEPPKRKNDDTNPTSSSKRPRASQTPRATVPQNSDANTSFTSAMSLNDA